MNKELIKGKKTLRKKVKNFNSVIDNQYHKLFSNSSTSSGKSVRFGCLLILD